jgi:hypothetical protein
MRYIFLSKDSFCLEIRHMLDLVVEGARNTLLYEYEKLFSLVIGK